MTTQNEIISAVDRGERVKPQYSMYPAEIEIGPHEHNWRCIACDGDRDALECRECGKQITRTCDFDEEYS